VGVPDDILCVSICAEMMMMMVMMMGFWWWFGFVVCCTCTAASLHFPNQMLSPCEMMRADGSHFLSYDDLTESNPILRMM
jgi:hypothetical protein